MRTDLIVSVIIPCHNRLNYLRECLESVAFQTYPSIELIISDDASIPGEISKLVDTLGWSHKTIIRHVRSEMNLGPGHARELGRQVASGQFVAYLDSDDIWQPHFLHSQLKNLTEHPEAGMSYCAMKRFGSTPFVGNEDFHQSSLSAHDNFFPALLRGRPWGTSACLWTKEAIQRIGPWPNTRACEDLAYDWKAGCLDIKVTHNPEMLSYVRRGNHFEHITNLDQSKLMELNLSSYQQMVETAFDTRKIQDPTLREWLIALFYKLGFDMNSQGSSALASKFFGTAKEIRNRYQLLET